MSASQNDSEEKSVTSVDDLDADDFDGIVSDDDGTPRFTVEVVNNTGTGPHEE